LGAAVLDTNSEIQSKSHFGCNRRYDAFDRLVFLRVVVVFIAMTNNELCAITGITGKVGGAVARNLLGANQSLRAVVRDADKGTAWAERGCEVALADMNDATALAAGFKGAKAVFVLLPSNFDPKPAFPEVQAVIAAVRSALEAARPAKVVCLSTIGAQATETNLLTQLSLMEQSLAELPMPMAFLRPAWFMENSSWDVRPARD
jgi:NAD(P)H dehydrogenase (quinone)